MQLSKSEIKAWQEMTPSNPQELWDWIRIVLNVTVPKKRCCKGHVSPFEALSIAYFAWAPICVWHASRGFGGKCQPYSEFVECPDGQLRTWGDLLSLPPEQILVPSPTGSDVSGPVIWKNAIVEPNGFQDIVELTLESGHSFGRTSEHPVWLASPERIRKTAVRVNVKGMTPIEKVSLGDMLLCPIKMPEPMVTISRPNHEISLLGLLLADGGTTEDFVTFTDEDKDTVSWMKSDWESLGGYVSQHKENTYRLNFGTPKGSRTRHLTECFRFMKDTGMVHQGSHEKSFPLWAWSLPDRQLALLLGRLWSTDGWIQLEGKSKYARPKVVFEITSEKMCRDIARAMHRLGVPGILSGPHISSYRDKSGKKHEAKDTWKWTAFSFAHKLFCQSIIRTFLSSKCQDSVDEISEFLKSNKERVKSWRSRNAPEGYFWQKVQKIEYSACETVAVEVPDGNIFCSPFVEHNSFMLALLGLTEAITLRRSKISILGGSKEQSLRVQAYLNNSDPNSKGRFWEGPYAPRHLRPKTIMGEKFFLMNGSPDIETGEPTEGSLIKTLAASATSIRGDHPTRLRMDEIDELSLREFDSAMGLTMATGGQGYPAQTVLSSTWQHSEGTMTEILRRAKSKGWKVCDWCHWESSAAPHGWLPVTEITRKQHETTDIMWKTEYELKGPIASDRAIDSDSVNIVFSKMRAEVSGAENRPYIFEKPRAGCRYYHGIDWARKADWSIFHTMRYSLVPGEPDVLVAWGRYARMAWPLIVAKARKQIEMFPGAIAYDAEGVGDVAGQYLEGHHVEDGPPTEEQRIALQLPAGCSIEPMILRGKNRRDIINAYIYAIEHHEVSYPHIEWMYQEHMTVERSDIDGTGHLPDSISAGCLAWYIRAKATPLADMIAVHPDTQFDSENYHLPVWERDSALNRQRSSLYNGDESSVFERITSRNPIGRFFGR